MRNFLFLLICTVGFSSQAQTIMNIYQSNEPVLQLPIADIDSITYSAVGDPGLLPDVATLPLGAFSATTATLGGEIFPNGGTAVTHRGVVWSIDPDPTTADSTTLDGSGTGIYASVLTGLEANTVYYCKAYATNGAGTAYGNEVSFTATNDYFIPGDGVTDSDGNFYNTILMGNGQEWMSENLYSLLYANEDTIENVTNESIWAGMETGAWAYYNNDQQHESTYGKLYNGWAVDDPRNICPIDWHVPTDAEWTLLTTHLGGQSASGGKLKSTGFAHWLDPNNGATNESGFTGLPGGTCNGSGDFGEMYGTGAWWASTGNSFALYRRVLYYTTSGTWRDTAGKANGLSVRCIRD
ncbi:MAG: hypothetical protein GY751_01100 [Bacteroidetes bacterium]|nr:hypothetical protein [Bacteroidota bacterium]